MTADVRSRILLVEDNPADVYLVKESFHIHEIACPLDVLSDGEAAIQLIDQLDGESTPTPLAAVLLDMNLPKRRGDEVVERLRRSERYEAVPVIFLTASQAPADLALVQRLRGYYFRKSERLDEYLELGALVKRVVNSGCHVKAKA